MSNPRWPGVATAVAILWILSNIVWLGIAGPIWHASSKASGDAWIGFAGNALGACVTLLAAVAAGIAAFKTVIPMQQQLQELVRQNNFAHYERLRERAATLWDQRLLIERTNADLEVMDVAIRTWPFGNKQIAFDRLEESAQRLNVSRRLVWGDQNAQSLTKYYADHVLIAANYARSSLPDSTEQFEHETWERKKNDAWRAGVALFNRINLEIVVLSNDIAHLEPLILSRKASFPQFWEGDYPGPDRMAEIYRAKVANKESER